MVWFAVWTVLVLGAVACAVLLALLVAGVVLSVLVVGLVALLAVALSGVVVARVERYRLRIVDGVRLTAAGFLNLTQDHLDYHGTMGAYRQAKLRLFDTLLPRGAWAVLNADSPAFPAFAATAVTGGRAIMSVGAMGQGLTLAGRQVEGAGQRLAINAWGRSHLARLPLAGAFQVSNALVAAGLSNKEIAEQLYLSINSIKTYIRSAYRRIGAASRSEAVLWALRHGLAEPDPRKSDDPAH